MTSAAFLWVGIRWGRIFGAGIEPSALLYNSLSLHYLVILDVKQIDLNTLGIFILWPVNFITGYIRGCLNAVLNLRIEIFDSRPELFSCLPR